MRAIWLGSFVTDTIYLAAGAFTSRFIGSPLQKALARRRYGSLAAHYDADVIPQAGYFAPLEAALSRLPAPPASALDVSTGTGAVISAVMRRFPSCRAFAVDLSPAMLSRAVRNTRHEGLRARFASANAARLPFPPASFDLVTVQNAFPVPRELVRVAKPGGWVILCYSAGGPVFPWIVRSLAGQFRALGCEGVETHRVETGRYFLARRGVGVTQA
ncbi:MAG: methyltransferase domain-containing protein [Armatimonadota bacterium]|nr:methyltransferase domain-containing protein [Armatimonadota bacterium]